MYKKTIRLDARERDLARRALEVIGKELDEFSARLLQKFAAEWTRDEIRDLAGKFAEPPSK